MEQEITYQAIAYDNTENKKKTSPNIYSLTHLVKWIKNHKVWCVSCGGINGAYNEYGIMSELKIIKKVNGKTVKECVIKTREIPSYNADFFNPTATHDEDNTVKVLCDCDGIDCKYREIINGQKRCQQTKAFCETSPIDCLLSEIII